MTKNKLISIIVTVSILTIAIVCIVIGVATDSPKEEYINDIAHHVSLLETEFSVETSFKPKYEDATVPDIFKAARKYDSASAALMTSIHFNGAQKTTTGYKTTFTVTYAMSMQDYNSLYYWIEENILSTITATNDYDKAKELYNYIIDNCTTGDNGNPANLLKGNKTGNQQAYAIAYKMLLDAAGIDSEYVYKKGYHWNIVELDGMWFNVDVYRADYYDSIDYKYFMQGKKNWDGYSGSEATSPYAYNSESPATTTALYYIYYTILHLGWPLATIVFIIILFNRKKL